MSSGSVPHSSSNTSSQPSPSSSGSNSSGTPSPSVSSRLAVMVMSKECRNRLFDATAVKTTASTSSPIIPLISPLELLKNKPSGISGVTDQEDTLPPKITGARKISSTCTVRIRFASR